MKRIATKPTKQLLYLCIAPGALALVHALLILFSSVGGSSLSKQTDTLLTQSWGWLVFVLAVVAAVDYYSGRKTPPLHFSRQCKDILSLHRWSSITLTVQTQALDKPMMLTLVELADSTLELSQDPLQAELRPPAQTRLSYQARASHRGDVHIRGLQFLWPSDFKLWQSVWQADEQSTLKVYPDFQAISGYTLMAQDNNTSQLGIRRKPRRGEGMDFHQLREYQKGDTSRQIDWKATARKQKLISREYQDERDQQIVVLLDNGRRMRSEDEKLGHLDHAINAMSLLSHIALKQGDAVGMMTFGHDKRWLPGQKGSSHINTILNHVYDLQPGTHASDYSAAAQSLVQLQRKRALVILITNTRDEDFDDLMPAIKLIGKHHLILLANIREPILQKTLDEPVQDLDDAYRYIGAMDYLQRRQQVKQRLTDAGVFMVDCHPQNLPIEVCNSYLAIKRSGVL